MKPKSKIPNPPPKIIVVGASLGGLSALKVLFSALPANFSIPAAVVLHRDSHSSEEILTALVE